MLYCVYKESIVSKPVVAGDYFYFDMLAIDWRFSQHGWGNILLNIDAKTWMHVYLSLNSESTTSA